MIDPAKSLASPSASKDELSSLLDRARQERFRLLDLLKQSRQSVEKSAVKVASGSESPMAPAVSGVPTESVSRLITKVEQLNQHVTDRLTKLKATEQRVDTRIEQLERLELKMSNLAERFEAVVGEATELQPVIDQADARTAELRTLADSLQQHGSDLSRLVDARLAEQTADFEKKLDDHHERVVAQQISEQQSFADAVARQKQNHLDQLQRELNDKRFELQQAFAQAGKDAEQRAGEMVDETMHGTEGEVLDRLAELRKQFAAESDQFVTEAEQRGRGALDRAREQVIQAMSRADDVTRSLKQRLDKALDEHRTKLNDAIAAGDDDLLVRSQKLDERLAGLADLFDHQSDQIVEDLKQRANRMLDSMAASLNTVAKPEFDEQDGPQIRAA